MIVKTTYLKTPNPKSMKNTFKKLANVLISNHMTVATMTRSKAVELIAQSDMRKVLYADGKSMSDDTWTSIRSAMHDMEAHKWQTISSREAGIAMLATAGITVTFSGEDLWPNNPCCSLWEDGKRFMGCSSSQWLSDPVHVMREILRRQHNKGFSAGEQSAQKKMREALGL